MFRVRVIALVMGLLAAIVVAGSVVAAAGQVTMTEANGRYAFTPAKTFVNVGATVTWTNGTDAAHTVRSDSGSELASSTLNQNAAFRHTFSSTGTFTYHCSIHSYMKGSVVVLAAGVTPPPTDTVAAPPTKSQSAPAGLAIGLLLASALVAVGLFSRRRRT
jgi:plastocyanin